MARNDSFSFSLCSWLLLVKRPLKNLIHWGASPLGWRLDRHIWKTSLSLLKTHWSPKRKRCLTEFQVWFIMFAEWVRYYTKENTKKHDLEQDFLREGKHQKAHFWHEGKTLKTKFAQTITNPIFGGHSYENSYNLYCNFKITSPLDITPDSVVPNWHLPAIPQLADPLPISCRLQQGTGPLQQGTGRNDLVQWASMGI